MTKLQGILCKFYEEYYYEQHGLNEEDRGQAIAQAISEIEGLVPEEKKPIKVKVGNLKLTKCDGFTMGWNACREEMLRRVK